MTIGASDQLLDTLCFKAGDLRRFQTASGDRNPLHTDAAYARKTAFGNRVVFGALGVLSALERLDDPRSVVGLTVEFRKPLFPDRPYALVQTAVSEHGVELELRDGDLVATHLAVDFGTLPPAPPAGKTAVPHPREVPASLDAATLSAPLHLQGHWRRGGGKPVAAPLIADTLMAASYLVGMEAPGERALFSKLTVRFHHASYSGRPALAYDLHARRFEPSFGLLSADVHLRLGDTVVADLHLSAFLRDSLPAPTVPRVDDPHALKGRNVLVIGGSRGLGAALVLRLAASGCRVILNYHASQAEAEAVATLAAETSGSVHLLRADASKPTFARLLRETVPVGDLHQIYFNACAPPVQLPHTDAGRRRAQSYLRRNLNLVAAPLKACTPLLAPHAALVVVSSVYAGDDTCPFPHYAQLKARVETLAEETAAHRPDTTVLVVRPPVLRTQMSSTPGGAAAALPPETAAATILNSLQQTHTPGLQRLDRFPSPDAVATQAEPPPVVAPPAASAGTQRLVVAAGFTVDPLLPALRYWCRWFDWPLAVEPAPYHQLFQQLLGHTPELRANRDGFNVVLLRFEDWLRDLPGHPDPAATDAHLTRLTEELVDAVTAYAAAGAADLLVMLCPSSPALETRLPPRRAAALRRMLADGIAPLPRVDWLEAADYHRAYGVAGDPYDAVRDEMGHMPFSPAYYHVLGTLIARRYHALAAPPFKVVCVDCDNTLWEGVCGEDGPTGVRIGRHEIALQEALIAAGRAGMLLTLASKNVPEDVDAVFAQHDGMRLTRSHVVDARVNWQPKSANLRDLAASLDLGLDSFVFIDDNPVEIAEVGAGCPAVTCLPWPEDPAARDRFLDHLWVLDRPRVTAEDEGRTDMYRAEQDRKHLRAQAGDFQSFLDGLALQVTLAEAEPDTFPRVTQLSTRTNQFNFTTRRFSEAEIRAQAQAPDRRILTCTVSDRFGSYGLVGVLMLDLAPDAVHVTDFLLSCRALGRGVEHRLLAEAGRVALENNRADVRILFAATAKNLPARRFLDGLGTPTQEADHLVWQMPAARLAALTWTPEAPAASAPPTEKPAPPNADTRADAARYLHVMALGDMAALEAALADTPDHPPVQPPAEDDAEPWVRALFGRILHLDGQALDGEAGLEQYVRDSFNRVELTVALKERYPELPTTFLFEQRSLNAVVAHLRRRDDAPDTSTSPRASDPPGHMPIAVIGMSGRFPGAPDVEALWDLLCAGRDAMTEVPPDRWDVDRYWADTLAPGKTYCRKGGFMEDVGHFDAAFFHISPKEAELMDPQQRLLLETVWNLFEDAGVTARTREPETAVFVGVNAGDYGLMTSVAALGGAGAYRHADYYQLANRISYFFDLNGPSLTLDTACSSSGTAVYLAVETMRTGRAQAAVVGGINLFLHPSRFVQYAHMRMISPSGRCCPFGEGADGTVFGEGVGALLLKPLSRAQTDGDPIHGVILACAVNSGGKTNGFTVPNPAAQARLVGAALREANVDPATISYVEAHGTGTTLGDPIEVRGLSLAFEQAFKRVGRPMTPGACALGSLKANIGHLEAAAALPGIIKVLLQMQRRTLVPSLNAARENPKIDFATGPFHIQKTLAPWEPPQLEGQGPVPRRAGVSSFGAGGSNAHVILEEAPPQAQTAAIDGPHLFVLSARTPERLTARAARLAAWTARPHSAASAADIAYTLLTGREHMEHRLALVAPDLAAFAAGLQAAAQDQPHPGLVRGTSGDGQHAVSGLLEGDEGRAYLDTLYARHNLAKLARLWLAGIDLDETRLYPDARPVRVHLPGYPFQGERHWLPQHLARAAEGDVGVLHPLLDALHPGLSLDQGLTFTKKFRPGDRLLQHHRVGGLPTLPGVAYLTMACAALAHISPGERPCLQRVTWKAPFSPTTETDLALNVWREDQSLAFRFYTPGPEGTEHCTGRLSAATPEEVPAGALDAEAAACPTLLDHRRIYARFRGMGIAYGPYFQGLQDVRVGPDKVVARLQLPRGYRAELAGMSPHPTLADAALQAALFLFADDGRPAMPFSVSEVHVLRPVTADARVLAERAGNEATITLYDDQDRACLRYRGFSFRAGKDPHEDFYFLPRAKPEPLPALPAVPDLRRVLIVRPDRDGGLGKALADLHVGAEVTTLVTARTGGLKRGKQQTVSTAEAGPLLEALRRCPPPERIYFLGALDTQVPALHDLAGQKGLYRQGVLTLFRLIGMLPKLGRPQLVVVTADSFHGDTERRNPLGAAVGALCTTLSKEQPKQEVHCLDIDGAELAHDAHAVARVVAGDPGIRGEVVYWRGRLRRRMVLERVSVPRAETPIFQHGGTYLILGGTGGIGRVLSKRLAADYGARLALVGRRAEDDDILDLCAELVALGGEARYFSADAADPEQLAATVDRIHDTWGAVQGVVHSAIVLADKTLAKMDEAGFEEAFAVKFLGTVALHRALRDKPLDFVLYFSSVNSFTTPAGQANYSAGCLFKDAFASALQGSGPRVCTINWGYWGTVGIVASPAYRERITAQGFRSIAPEQGLEALLRLSASPHPRVAAVKGEGPLLDTMGVQPGRLVSLPGTPLLEPVLAALQLPEPDTAHAAAQEQGLEKLEDLTAALVLGAFQQMGLFRTRGERVARHETAERVAVVPEYRLLLDSLVDMLLRRDLLRGNETYLALADAGEAPWVRFYIADPQRAASQLAADHPQISERLPLLLTCATALPEVLRGKRNHVSVVFPNGSLHLVENIYKSNPTTDYFNRTVAALVRATLARHPADATRPFRILEVGAGTGGTASWVLPELDDFADRVTYVYSDVSKRFTRHGQEHYGAKRPYVRFEVLDMEKDPAAQGFAPGEFDLILGTNCLHAVRRMDTTLWYLKRLLRSGGLLVANEFVTRLDYNTLTFGLTSGWWLFQDGHCRIPHAPLLRVAEWRTLCRTLGYEGFHTLPFPQGGAPGLGQVVMIAQSDGLVSVPEPTAPAAVAAVEAPEPTPVVSPMQPVAALPPRPAMPPAAGADLHTRTLGLLRDIFADVLRIRGTRIDAGAGFDKLGIDSLISLEIVERLEKRFGTLNDVLLFEYDTLAKLTDYFVTHHRAALNDVPTAAAGQTPAQTSVFDTARSPFAAPAPIAAAPLPGPAQPPHDTQTSHAASLPKGVGPADIAVIGIAGRYPRSPDLDGLWQNLLEGRDCIRPIPPTRWPVEGDHPRNRWGGFLDDVDRFDAPFFNIAPNEAALIDPAERLFLETAWHALEDAGLCGERLQACQARRGPVGVFAGCMYQQYPLLTDDLATAERLANNSYWSIANRVSFFFDLKGPSLALDTACSSALSALHVAVQHVRDESCAMAVVGGVNLSLSVGKYRNLQRLGMLGSSPESRSMGAGDGLVPAEGVGVAVLKPLAHALADGDPVWGVIKGTAVNHGGRTAGFTVPSPGAHGDVAARALARANVPVDTVTYVDVAANGSALGDPIEISGLARAYTPAGGARGTCALGSVKSNLGHSEAASGMAQLFKVLLQMKHRTLVGTLHAQPPNPSLALADGPFFIQHQTGPWQAVGDAPLRAGINTFGAGGANAHVVVEAPPALPNDDDGLPAPILVLSARTEEALQRLAGAVCRTLERSADLPFAALLYTFQVGRRALPHRLAVVAGDRTELLEKLTGYLRGHQHLDEVFQGKAAASTERDAEDTLYFQALLQRHKPGKAAHLWVSGVDPQWQALYPNPPRMLSGLPLMPFAGARHWVERHPSPAPRTAAPLQVSVPTEPAPAAPAPSTAAADTRPPRDQTDVRAALFAWTIAQIGDILGLDPAEIDRGMEMNELGLDSVNLTELAERLSNHWDHPVNAGIFFGYAGLGSCLNALWEEIGPNLTTPDTRCTPPAAVTTPPPAPQPAQAPRATPVSSASRARDRAVAVIGMSGMLPQSPDLDAFWAHLLAGRELIREVPADRWDWQAIHGDPHQGRNQTRARWGAFLDDVGHFDPFFFGISPHEAELMDPQQRLLLLTVRRLFDHAGYPPRDYAGSRTGVFVAACNHDYDKLLRRDHVALQPHSATGSMVQPILANRLSYLFDLRGPSEIVDTACSSSAVALHRAVRAIQGGECDGAVVAGVNLLLHPDGFIMLDKAGILSTDGHVRLFHPDAQGYVRGEGVVSVLLKPLAQAEADGDQIHGIIRASATNHDGKSYSMTAPNPIAQEAVVAAALADGDIDPAGVAYIEAQGTGSPIGDPVEARALRKAYAGLGRGEGQGHTLGYLKPCVGHLESTYGLAATVKVLLAMRHGTMPATPLVHQAEAEAQLKPGNFRILAENQPWPRATDAAGHALPRRGAVHAYGFGGVNAHLILEEHLT